MPLGSFLADAEVYRAVVARVRFAHTFDGLEPRDFVHDFILKLARDEQKGKLWPVATAQDAIRLAAVSVKFGWFAYLRKKSSKRVACSEGDRSQAETAVSVEAVRVAALEQHQEAQLDRMSQAVGAIKPEALAPKCRQLFVYLNLNQALMEALTKSFPQKKIQSDLGWPQYQISRTLSEIRGEVEKRIQAPRL
jgi:hypothetical protein